MTRSLEGKIALITGGTTGIGRDTAVLFSKEGAKVAFTGRRETEGQQTLELVREAGGDGLFLKSDVSKADDVQSAVRNTVEKYGRLDVAFNNAGVEGVWVPLAEQTEENWDYVLGINLKGLWLCLKYEIQQMVKQGGGGAIVNMSSVAGLIGSPGAGVYIASKHGVLGLTKTAAAECAKQGIRVNAVCPAVIQTDMGERIFGEPELNRRIRGLHPLGRLGTPREVSEAVLWLCSDKSSFTTGHSLGIDGGLLIGPNPFAY
ncbi:MAG TPA: SDR family oxidoreductase [Candidatus Acidoferrum sp.]|jgi:NAD(P)-dependent dehydrogenase (short-subunit alcohol dehydrogenase family)